MKNNLYRTLAIYAVLIFTVIYIYPTIGWMMLSDQTRQERLKKWNDEDSVYHPPSFFSDAKKAITRWAECDRTKVVNLGLDLQGGVHMVIGFDLTDELKKQGVDEKYVQEMVLQRIRRRINDFEASDPTIQALGTKQIQVQLPGEKDLNRAKSLIMKTAFLTFNIVDGPDATKEAIRAVANAPQFKGKFTPYLKPPKGGNMAFRVPIEYFDRVSAVVKEATAGGGLIPEGKVLAFSPKPNPWDDQEYELYLMDKDPIMTGEGLTRAAYRPDDENPGKYEILFTFGAAAGAKFSEVTKANIGKPMGIVLDGVVCSAPTIQSQIGTQGRITGNFSQEQAKDLSIALNSGSMPVPVKEEYTGVVGASLGTDSIRQGVWSSVVGLVLVLAFMIVYYRFGGLIANVALFLNGFILTALFAYFKLTLTLPGIAGFVLTLGMAVDANVLIFERVREEVRNGKSLISSIEQGYQRAAVTVLDSNITTLIAALVLLQFGTGPVQGFGVALSLGILTSVFTALIVTKAIFDFIISKKMLRKLTMMSVIPPDTKIPFLANRNKCFVASLAVIAFGMLFFFGRGVNNNFGVDFAAGTNVVVRLDTDQKIAINEVRAKLDENGFKNTVVQEYGEGTAVSKNSFVFRTSEVGEETTATQEQGKDVESRVRTALAPLCQSAPGDFSKVILERVEKVGPAIGIQLRYDAINAVFWAFVFMVLYMWFRYSMVYGVMAIVALVHDTFACTGITLFFGHLDMNVVAAILTIIGYSVNDTVVVYDRIREISKLYAGRGLTLSQIMDLAINQTLSRTILTSVVTLLTVVALFLFGGEVLRSFSIYLGLGIVIGTYSSIFVASALAYVWQEWLRHRKIEAAGGRPTTSPRAMTKPRAKAKSQADEADAEA